MGCGCRKNRSNDSRARRTTSQTYEVYLNGQSTGRKFSSLVGAQSYAAKIGGEIRTN